MFVALSLAAALALPQSMPAQAGRRFETMTPRQVPGNPPNAPPENGPFGAPEIDANLARAGFALLAGGALMLLGRRRAAPVPVAESDHRGA